MSSNILVSVIVPTYNHQKYIQQCLQGIVAQQTNFNFEIIVGDDFSTDSNREKVMEVAIKHPDKFKILFHNKNLGPKEFPGKNNSIECVRAATGKYLAFCEGDDYWTDKNKLQKQADFLEQNPDYNLCYHKVAVTTENEEMVFNAADEGAPKDTTTIKDLLANGNYIHTPSVFYRNPFVKDFPDWYYKMSAGDFALYLLAVKDKKIKFLPEAMAVYHVHSQGQWGAKSHVENYKKEIKSLLFILEPFSEYKQIICNAIYDRYLSIAGEYRTNGDAAETLKIELKTMMFCLRYGFQSKRNHFSLAMNVIKDYFTHKLKTKPTRA